MKCYSCTRGRIAPGIEVTLHGRYGPSVLLGKRSLDSWEEIALLGGNDRTPKIQGKKVFETYPFWRGNRLFLVVADNPDDQVLLRVNTEGVWTQSKRGYWTVLRGSPRELLRGQCARGGRVVSDDTLIVLAPGDALEIHCEGLIPSVVALEKEGQIVCLPLETTHERRKKAPVPAAVVTA